MAIRLKRMQMYLLREAKRFPGIQEMSGWTSMYLLLDLLRIFLLWSSVRKIQREFLFKLLAKKGVKFANGCLVVVKLQKKVSVFCRDLKLMILHN